MQISLIIAILCIRTIVFIKSIRVISNLHVWYCCNLIVLYLKFLNNSKKGKKIQLYALSSKDMFNGSKIWEYVLPFLIHVFWIFLKIYYANWANLVKAKCVHYHFMQIARSSMMGIFHDYQHQSSSSSIILLSATFLIKWTYRVICPSIWYFEVRSWI